MLLVFFLVTSSMNSDKGLGRKLPPVDEHQQELRDVNRSNVLQVSLDASDVLYCDEKTGGVVCGFASDRSSYHCCEDQSSD